MRAFYFLLSLFIVVLMFAGAVILASGYTKTNRRMSSQQTVEIVNLRATVSFLEREFRVLRIAGNNMHNRLLELEKKGESNE